MSEDGPYSAQVREDSKDDGFEWRILIRNEVISKHGDLYGWAPDRDEAVEHATRKRDSLNSHHSRQHSGWETL